MVSKIRTASSWTLRAAGLAARSLRGTLRAYELSTTAENNTTRATFIQMFLGDLVENSTLDISTSTR
jgi:hypothetical protein